MWPGATGKPDVCARGPSLWRGYPLRTCVCEGTRLLCEGRRERDIPLPPPCVPGTITSHLTESLVKNSSKSFSLGFAVPEQRQELRKDALLLPPGHSSEGSPAPTCRSAHANEHLPTAYPTCSPHLPGPMSKLWPQPGTPTPLPWESLVWLASPRRADFL